MDDDLTLTTASRETLEANKPHGSFRNLRVICGGVWQQVRVFVPLDADDSGVVDHIVPGFDDDGETYDTDEF